MAHVDYFFSTISPFTYLAGTRLEEIAARHGASITYKPLDIMQLFARTGGVPPARRHPSRQEYRLIEIERQARRRGMPVNLEPRHFPTNMAPSSYAVIAAQRAVRAGEASGDLGRLVHGILRAVWAEDRDVASDEVIRAALAEAGFDPALADRGMMASAEEYAANLEEAVARGVFGAPFYITDDGARFWGQDRLEDLDAHLAARAGAAAGG